MIAPHYVHRAQDFMHSNADQPITVQTVAEHVGVSARSLHSAFQRYVSASPMTYLLDLRLEGVRRELLSARDSDSLTTIADVAMNWGFLHLGHFARAYAEKYGELPSRVLMS